MPLFKGRDLLSLAQTQSQLWIKQDPFVPPTFFFFFFGCRYITVTAQTRRLIGRGGGQRQQLVEMKIGALTGSAPVKVYVLVETQIDPSMVRCRVHQEANTGSLGAEGGGGDDDNHDDNDDIKLISCVHVQQLAYMQGWMQKHAL